MPQNFVDSSLRVLLGSIVIHVQEAGGPDGHPFDLAAAQTLASDPAVQAWLKLFEPGLLPVKRRP